MNCANALTELPLSDLVIRKATTEDLEDILTFLKQEYDEESTGSGFWCNRDLIVQGREIMSWRFWSNPATERFWRFVCGQLIGEAWISLRSDRHIGAGALGVT